MYLANQPVEKYPPVTHIQFHTISFHTCVMFLSIEVSFLGVLGLRVFGLFIYPKRCILTVKIQTSVQCPNIVGLDFDFLCVCSFFF